MKASELRIGNWFKFGELTHTMTHWDIRNLSVDEMRGRNTEAYRPIPLTEELLLKCGFVKGNAIYSTGYSIYIRKTDFYLRPAYKGGYYWGFNISDEKNDCELNDVRPIEYLHQLQNLYFALTEEELPITL